MREHIVNLFCLIKGVSGIALMAAHYFTYNAQISNKLMTNTLRGRTTPLQQALNTLQLCHTGQLGSKPYRLMTA
jgi:hypothetical protein